MRSAQSSLLNYPLKILAIVAALVWNNSYASQVNVGVEEAFETALEYLRQNRSAEALLITDSLKKVATDPLMLLEIGRIEFEFG